MVFASVTAHCYAVPYVHNDANVAEFLSLGSMFFILLIGLGQGTAIDKGLSESEGHEIVQQLYWIILASLCGISTIWIMIIICKRGKSLLHDSERANPCGGCC